MDRTGDAKAEIRQELGASADGPPLIVLGMDAHLDWDWLASFQELVEVPGIGGAGSARSIIEQAWKLMVQNQGLIPYRYSVCEMGFLRAVLDRDPTLLEQYRSNGLNRQLGLEGGGITSPDNLLPHGEAFIRCYLLGAAWQQATLGLTTTVCYLPDDFGHDPQLPVVLEAMGFPGVVFSRLPGSWPNYLHPTDGSLSLYDQLIDRGRDLIWQSADGSSVLVHALYHGYQDGNDLGNYCGDLGDGVSALQALVQAHQPSAPTGNVYIPCGNDFALPIGCLLDIAAAWNNKPPVPGQAVVGTLDQYMRLLLAWDKTHPGALVRRRMNPTPYWTGFYASRPANKILHHAAVRALVGAEIFGSVAEALQQSDQLAWVSLQAARRQVTAQAWEALMPSTHHDYITGTAVDSVYSEEQLPLLRATERAAQGAVDTAIQEIATLVEATPGVGEQPVLVANQTGVALRGLLEIPSVPGQTYRSVRLPDGSIGNVQLGAEGQLLIQGLAPPFGYNTVYLANPATQGGSVTARLLVGSAVLQNALVRVEITQARGWAITSFLWKGSQGDVEMVPTGQAANELVFYQDGGGLYNFGNEVGQSFAPSTGLTPGAASLLEGGPLRARVRAVAAFKNGSSGAQYAVEYELRDGEPFIRITVTGPAPFDPGNMYGQGWAVMARVPFADPARSSVGVPVDGVTRGTPYHWDNELPVPYWTGPTFQAAHGFVVPTYRGTPLGAIYHTDVPAWAIDSGGAMIGCLLRNTPSDDGRGACGIDQGIHRRCYALRVPGGLMVPPASGQVFQEAGAYGTPLRAAFVNVPDAGISGQHPVNVSFPSQFSLASVTSGNAVLTAAKPGQFNPGDLILRLYQWSNGPATVTVLLDGYLKATGATAPIVRRVTALEQPIPGTNPLPVTGGSIAFPATRALTTLAITPGNS